MEEKEWWKTKEGKQLVSRIFFASVGLAIIIFVYNQVKKHKLEEKESFFWILGSICILILAFFPKIINAMSRILHIDYPPSLLFLLGIIFTIGLVFRLTLYVTLMKQQIKELAQRNVLLEKRVLEIEKFHKKNT
ncbi:MAG: hypothetical protein K0R54_2403 [Clostridiaceae bacterium]|jgi:hypothetical protein|nr:hypothetical protein [Clostridiaceae bacterium]